jgi:hypothetical protein
MKRWSIGLTDGAAPDDFGSKLAYNMGLYEQCASLLCESEGLSSANVAPMFGLERKRSMKLVVDFTESYGVEALRVQR